VAGWAVARTGEPPSSTTDVGHLPAGSYTILAMAMDGIRYHGKFIKV
jgi:hypothetical protein